MSIQIEQLSEEEREEIINYGIRRSIVISISTIVTIMAGYLLGIVWQSIFFLFCFSALRKYAGGYHADTPIRCYFLSFITLFIALMGIKILQCDDNVGILIQTINLLIIIFLSPIDSVVHRLEYEEKKEYGTRAKKIALIYYVLYCILKKASIVYISTPIAVAYVHLAPANNMLKENDFEKIIENYFLYCEEFEKLLLEHKYKECIARHNLYSILREIHEGKKRNVYCAAGFKAISIDIDGYIYPCHRFVGDKEFCMGDVSTNVFEHDVIYNQLYKIPEKCKYCICQSICSGGCMHDNLLLMKNINIPAECNCKLQKFLTEQALKIYISLTDIDKKYLFGEESCYGG